MVDERNIEDFARHELFTFFVESSFYVAHKNGSLAFSPSSTAEGSGLGLVVYVPGGESEELPHELLPDEDHQFQEASELGFWGLVELLAQVGATSIRVLGVGSELVGRFVVSLDDLVADRPSAVAVFDDEQPLFMFDRTGLVELESDPMIEWLRFDRSDCFVAGDPASTASRSPLFGWNQGESFWELVGSSSERLLIQSSAELGVFMPPEGAFVAFTSHDEALRAEALLPVRRMIDRRGQPAARDILLQPMRIGSLRNWVKQVWALNRFRSTRFVIDPHVPRHCVGLGDPALGPFVRTTQGWWAIEPDNRLTLDHVCHLSGGDTIHWDGSHGWPAEPPETSYGQPTNGELQKLRLLTERERRRAHQAGRFGVPTPPANLADSYLLATSDRLTGEVCFRFFEDQLGALQWLRDFEATSELPWRLNGRQIDEERFTNPMGDPQMVQMNSDGFALATNNLIECALLEPLGREFDKRLSALANRMFAQLRIEICGLTIDVLHGVKELDQQSDLLSAALGLDWHEARKRLVEFGSYELDPASSERCRSALGEEALMGLSPEARWFLGAGLTQLEDAGSRPDADQAGPSIQLTRALEFELGLLFSAARDTLARRGVSPSSDDESPLARFMNGGVALTCGQVLHYVRRQDDPATTLWSAFRAVIGEEFGAKVLFSKAWWKRLKSLTFGVRNSAAHTTPISAEDAAKAFDLVVGTTARPGLLPELVQSWKKTERPAATTMPIDGRRTVTADHVAVSFTREELESREPEPQSAPVSFDKDPNGLPSRPGAASPIDELNPMLITVDGHSVWREIADGFIVAKPENGPLYLLSTPLREGELVTDEAGIVDYVYRIWSLERTQELARALSRRTVRWRARPGDEMFSRSDGGLSFRFRLDSGAHQLKSLSPEESAEFSSLIDALAAGRFGAIVSRRGDSPEALFGAVEEYWEGRALEREQRLRDNEELISE